jgi:ABC-type nitrate/sulfonate/bicarbonate transport system substrate-binding protein
MSMFHLSRRSFTVLAAAFSMATAGVVSLPAQAQQKPVIKVSSLTLPVFNPLVWNIMKAQGFDAKHASSWTPRPILRSQRSTPVSRQVKPTF